jgi:DNA-binding NarL/FixJ family response regulator
MDRERPLPATGGASVPVPVLVVDDHTSFRAVVGALVALTPGFRVAGETATGEDAVVAARVLGTPLVLMDIGLPGISGIEATRQILAADPRVVVVLLSTYTEGDLPADAWTCGAARYVHKEQMTPAVLAEVWAESSTRWG